MAQSFGQYFQDIYNENGHMGYVRVHYDVTPFCRGNIKNGNGNIMNTLQSLLIEAIHTQWLLPKAIVIVLDDNLLDCLDHYDFGASVGIGKLIEWLANQFHRVVTAHKEKLPSKSRKFKYPTLLWVLIPGHEVYGHYNDYKEKYNKMVKSTVALLREMEFINIEDTWDRTDLTYFAEGRMSSIGWSTYWHAINKAIEKWDRNQLQMRSRSTDMPKTNFGRRENSKNYTKHFHRQRPNDKYHWSAPKAKFALPRLGGHH